MLEAYLTESEEFEDLLHFCTVCYETLPYTIGGAREDLKSREERMSTLATSQS